MAFTKPINTYDSVVAATLDKLRPKIPEQMLQTNQFFKIKKAVNGEEVKALLYLPDRIKELELTQQFYVFTFVDKHDKHHICRLISSGKISYYASDEVTQAMLLERSEAVIKSASWSRFEYAYELKDLANKVAAKPYRDKFSQAVFVEAKDKPTLSIEDQLKAQALTPFEIFDRPDPPKKPQSKPVELEVVGEEPQRLFMLGGDDE